MSEMYIQSLRNRIRAMNTLYARCVTDMTLEQVNHHERTGVLPIAFGLSHYVRAQDQAISAPFLRERPIWDSGRWAGQVGVTIDRLGREETVEEMEQIRFADFDAWRRYQTAVIERTDRVLDTLTDGLLAEVLMPQLAAEHATDLLRARH